MRWKSVLLVGALGPASVGCNLARLASHNIVNEPLVNHTQHVIHRDLRHEANATWREVRTQYPRRAFTAEFRDGFTDGYVDYLDRGGNGSIPAVPPNKYVRHARYFTEEGQCRVKDYFLGFKYGQEIAIATGKRQFLTVPVLLPQQGDCPPAFTIIPAPGAVPSGELRQPTPVPIPTPPPAPTPVPTPQRFPNPAAKGEPPVAASPAPPEPNRLPAPNPLVPVPEKPAVKAPTEAPPISVPTVKLPAPPAEVPEFPPYIPTPPVTDDLPVIPPIHAEPPVVPPLPLEASGK